VRGRRRLAALLAAPLALAPRPAAAWPAQITGSLLRDAQRLVPRTLARLVGEREKELLEQAQRFPPELGQALAVDLGAGRLQPATLLSLDGHARHAVEMLRNRRVGDGILHLGSVLRIPADLSDPVLSAGPEGYPPGVVQEYYAFIQANLDKIPVVLDDPEALKLERRDLGGYWQRILSRSREQSGVIRAELFRGGRVVPHRAIDFRSPVFAVASLSYSRAVTAIAATWLALWRESRGDLTRQPVPIFRTPFDPAVAGRPAPSSPGPPAPPSPASAEGPKP